MEETTKEKLLKDYPPFISISKAEIIFKQMKKNICKLCLKDGSKGTGFFCKIPFPDQDHLLTVLITNNHIINDSYLNEEEKIYFRIYKNNDKNGNIKNIKINNRKKYSSKKYDITIIEIKKNEDNINDS